MRHVPDEELHAYLDQALSRSQCIEIETHIARCVRCRDARDATAALRDRTTALLATTAPRIGAPPPLHTLLARAEAKRKTSWMRRAILAASFGGAILAGWGMRAALDPHDDVEAARLAQVDPPPRALPIPQSPVTDQVSTDGPRITSPAPEPSTPVRLAADGLSEPEATIGRGALAPASAGAPAKVSLVLDEAWRNSDPAASGGGVAPGMLPTYPGLPVTEVRVHDAAPGQRPLLIVSQLHESGTTLYTVEGPADRVAAIIATQLAGSPAGFQSSDPSRSPPDYVETPSGYRRTHRVLAVLGSLPFDTLNAIAQRIVLR